MALPQLLRQAAMHTRIQPTQQQLEVAYRMRRNAGWPATLKEAMADPLLAMVLRADAVRRVLADRRKPQPPAATGPVSPGIPLTRPPRFDWKRAAAGDRD